MLVLLAVSLLLADCARRVSGSGCLLVRVRPQVPGPSGVSVAPVALLPPSLCLQRLSPPGAPSLVCLNRAPVLSAEGRGLKD